MTNVNTLDNVGNPAAIPKLVVADGSSVGITFQAASTNRIVSQRLNIGNLNWPQFANGAFKVLKPGGQIAMNVHVNPGQSVQGAVRALTAAGFRGVPATGHGWHTFITATR